MNRTPNHEQSVQIWICLLEGQYQHDIAAKFGFNQGRISEVKQGKRFPGAYDEALKRLGWQDHG